MGQVSKPKMKAVIFAGGIGTRMWPLSREKSPKQFEKIIEGKSTLQLTVERLLPEFAYQDIFISTGARYADLVRNQLPQIPSKNVIGEPVMRDVAPAVGYVMSILEKKHPNTPTAILWSDHLVKNTQEFKKALIVGSNYIDHNSDQIVFLGQKPRFPSQNLGWIEFGQETQKIDGLSIKEFISWHYRPDLKTAENYFHSQNHAWNPGYFIVTPSFVLKKFKKFAPEVYKKLKSLQKTYGTKAHSKNLELTYPKLPKISFDNLIVENIPSNEAVVISVDLGWSDLGAWEALKEALESKPDQNITHGNIRTKDTKDSLIYSYTNQLVTTIDLEGAVVVVTPDVVMVTTKKSIPKVKDIVNQLKKDGLEEYT